jgi:hypothetical protein
MDFMIDIWTGDMAALSVLFIFLIPIFLLAAAVGAANDKRKGRK